MSTITQGPYALGNIVTLRFCFTLRPLTTTEQAAFLAGQGLPDGVGVDQPVVSVVWGPENTTITGSGVSHDATGAYSAQVTPAAAGLYGYKGYATGLDGSAIAATLPAGFAIV